MRKNNSQKLKKNRCTTSRYYEGKSFLANLNFHKKIRIANLVNFSLKFMRTRSANFRADDKMPTSFLCCIGTSII